MANILQRLDARLTRAALDHLKAGIGYPNPGWAPPPGYVGPSSVGITINEDRANTVSAWYAGIRNISEDVASLPLILYRRSGANRDRATDHPLYRLLHDAPNPEMTSFTFRATLQAHAMAWGNGYAEKEINASGRVIALWPLRPDRMEVAWENGRRVYYYRPAAFGQPIRLSSDRIFHLPGLGFDGLQGYSILRLARETLGQAIALREYGGRVLVNDARPGMVLTHPDTLSNTARQNIEDSWAKANAEKGAGRLALLEEGLDVKTFGYPPEDIQFLESQQWQVTEIARWLRIAPHKIGDLSRATFSNIEEQGLDHVVSTLRAWLVRWEQQLNKDVVQDPDLYVEHLVDALLRGDSTTRAAAANIQFRAGALLLDEWRAMENRNPLPNGLGALPMVSADMQSMADLDEERKLARMLEQVKAGLITLDEGRSQIGLPPMEWGSGPSPEETATMLELLRAGVLTHQELREAIGKGPAEWDNDLGPDEIASLLEQLKAGVLTHDEVRTALGRGPAEWDNDLGPDEIASLIDQVKAGLRTENEVRALMKLPPIEWGDDLGPDEVTSLIDQVKAGLLTENEARDLMKRPPMEWAEGPSPDEIASLIEQVKEGLLTNDEARAILGREPIAWPEDLSEKVQQAADLIKAGFDPADVMRHLGLPPIRHLGLPPVTVQKMADADPSAVAPTPEALP